MVNQIVNIRGGVLKWADTIGSNHIRDRLASWDREFGGIIKSHFFTPSQFLNQRADSREQLVSVELTLGLQLQVLLKNVHTLCFLV